MTKIIDQMQKESRINIFDLRTQPKRFVGRPFYLDYDKLNLLTFDSKKEVVKGIPQSSFLLAFYDNSKDSSVQEALLLRVLKPTRIPQENDMVTTMIEFYKEDKDTGIASKEIDSFTRFELSVSGLECRILGEFYVDKNGEIAFGSDVENFYAPTNYSVFKPTEKMLEFIVNSGLKENKSRIGKTRFSSSRRFQESEAEVPVYISEKDIVGQRTALFGMTRTGKSNTVKKIIDATASLSKNSKVGQIIFDINGEYANANLQDEGTAIFEKHREDTIRYSTLEKDGFKVLKVNFFEEIKTGFELICDFLKDDSSAYIKSFRTVDFSKPSNDDFSGNKRWERKVAAYKCCLYKAGYGGGNSKIKFEVNKTILESYKNGITPKTGVTLDEAFNFFKWVFENKKDKVFEGTEGKNWIDSDLEAILTFLTKFDQTGSGGYVKIRPLKEYHTNTNDTPFEIEIVDALRKGGIVIVDLSQGNPEIQRTFSERICTKVFNDSMDRFIKMELENYIQFYFEEAHNLFPKKDDKDLTQIYNRIAKEGAKLHLGMVYATQEVSSISSNILKNTQNWFISHLNNTDEISELKKFYDFSDFADQLIKYSAGNDKGFARVKTLSNSFVIPTQIDKFEA